VSTYSEALALQESLPKTGAVPWELAKVYNALLAAAKKHNPGSVALGALEPLEQNAFGRVPNVTADSLRTMVAVVAAALEPPSTGD
jgi:hypothetical protein